MKWVAAIALALVLTGSIATRVEAQSQRVTLAVTGNSTTPFPTPGIADYQAGHIDRVAPISFSLTGGNQGSSWTVSARVEICAVNPDLTNGKALPDLQWTTDGSTYHPIEQNCTAPAKPSRTVALTTIGKSGSYTGSVALRMLLNWATDTQASYGTPVQLALTLTAP